MAQPFFCSFPSCYIRDMSVKRLKELGAGIAHLFYPGLCEGCNKPLLAGEEVLCISCAVQLPETAYASIADNETANRFAGRVPFLYASSLAWFTDDGLLQHLLHGLKYRGKKEIGSYLGGLLGAQIQRGLSLLPGSLPVDLVIPVPLHKAKLAHRGYNQSLLIAEGISSILGIQASDNILIRTRNTESQTNKSRAERINNMEAAFELRAGSRLTGKHILICDDVLTTGATLEACALALAADSTIKISLASVGIAVS